MRNAPRQDRRSNRWIVVWRHRLQLVAQHERPASPVGRQPGAHAMRQGLRHHDEITLRAHKSEVIRAV